jgi:hypothetical protein
MLALLSMTIPESLSAFTRYRNELFKRPKWSSFRKLMLWRRPQYSSQKVNRGLKHVVGEEEEEEEELEFIYQISTTGPPDAILPTESQKN